LILYEHAVDRKIRDMKFSAILHGADPKDLEDKELPSASTKEDSLVFGNPEDYKRMSKEEQKALSDKMKKKFMSWAGVRKNG